MSVRTADVVAQAEKARVFSLRDAFAGAPAVARTAPPWREAPPICAGPVEEGGGGGGSAR